MKKIPVFLVGLIAGFLGLETLTAPRSIVAASRPAASKDSVAIDAPETPLTPETPPAATPLPGSTTTDSAVVLPASATPGVFFFFAPSSLYTNSVPTDIRKRLDVPDRSVLRADPEFVARFRELARTGLEKELLAQQWLSQLDPAKYHQVLEIAADQVVTRNLLPPIRGVASIAKQNEMSQENAARLEALLGPDELEAWAEFSRINAGYFFRSTIEAFALRGLPLPTREQLDAMLPVGKQGSSDGRYYRTRQFDPAAAAESMNHQQRDYITNVARWNHARLIVDNINHTKVRDPEVWEIWPD